MMDIQIGNPDFRWLIGFSAVAIALSVWSSIARKNAAAKFATEELWRNMGGNRSRAASIISTISVAAGIALLAIALMDIRWGKTTREVPQKGIEVMFALDVSRSMLAEDVSPNRLERAKQQIKDMIDEMAGDRIGLVVFAGEADQAVPLTSHYDDFKQILDAVGPHSVMRGGSRLGDAIQAGAGGFIGKTNDHKTIVLFTDGEDQESQPIELARQLHASDGMRIFTVGLGDIDQGSRIPDTDSKRRRFVEHEGQQVWSKLNGQILRAIATETDAAFIPAGTKRVNMADIYHGYVANIEQTEFETAKIDAYTARFQWFAAAALILLIIEAWIATRGPKSKGTRVVTAYGEPTAERLGGSSIASESGYTAESPHQKWKVGAASVVLTLMFTLPVAAQPGQSVSSQINAANQLLRDQKPADAIEAYQQIDDANGQHRDLLNYNLAIAHYRNGDFSAAQTLFADVARSNNSGLAADSRYNLGNCHYSHALQLQQQERDAAIKQLKTAINSYRSSLRLNRDNADARANIELAGNLLRQLQAQQQQNQQQPQRNQEQSPDENQQDKQPQDSPNQDSQDQDPWDQDTNQRQSESESQSEPPSNRQPSGQEGQRQPDESSDSEPSDNQQRTELSSDPNEPTENTGDQSMPESESDADRSSQQPSRPQHQSADNRREGDDVAVDNKERDTKQPPTGDLTAVNRNKQNKKQGQSATVELDERAGLMTREEALKLLQSVRDRDMLRRLRQRQRERSRRIPVEKDW